MSQQDFDHAIDDYLDKFVRFVSERWVPLLGITGGLDSRTLVAAFASARTTFQSVTWLTMRTGQNERDLMDRQVALLAMPHRYLWIHLPRTRKKSKVEVRLDQLAAAGSSRTRPFAIVQALAGAFPDKRRDGEALTFVRGWGAEVLRGFYQLKKEPMTDFSAEEMARAYWMKVEDMGGDDDAKARALALEAFSAFRRRANFEDIEGLGYDPNDIFYLEHRMGTWGGLSLNELDPVMASVIGFNARPIFLAAWGLPPAKRLTKQLLRSVVVRHQPELAAIPVIGLDGTTPRDRPCMKPRKIRKPLGARHDGPVRRALGRLRRLLRGGS